MAPTAILDIDGTLIDSNYQHAIAWYRAFRAHGFVVQLWKIHRSIGMGGDQLVGSLIGEDAERAFTDTARETFEESLSRAAASLPDVEIDWHLLGGNVVEALSELDDVDVLFCGSRGYGPARRVLLGGVSTRLVRSAKRPLVVVPRSG